MDGLVQALRDALIGGGRALGPLAAVLTVLVTVMVFVGLFILAGLWVRARVRKGFGANPPVDDEGDHEEAMRVVAKRAVALPLGVLGTVVTLLCMTVLFAGAGIGARTVALRAAAPTGSTPPVPVPERTALPEVEPTSPGPVGDESGPAGSAGQSRTEDLYGENRVVLTSGRGCTTWEEGDVSVEGAFYEKGYTFQNTCGTQSDTASASYILGRRFSRFTVLVGIIDTSPYAGPVKVEVFLDEDEQQRASVSEVRVGQPLEVDIDVTGAVRVTVRVTLLGLEDYSEYVVGFVDAKGVTR